MIDKSKQYRTRDGREVRIYAVDGVGSQPVHGTISGVISCWTAEGRYPFDADASPHPADLIEVKPRIKREVWVNVYPKDIGNNNKTREEADRFAGYTRIACVKLTIDCEEGEGL